MIASLRGTLAAKLPNSAIVEAGGVGYEVFIPLSTFYDLPDEGAAVHLQIRTVVREDAIELFGFLTPAEKKAFQALNGVSKVGPRLALAILSGIGPADLVRAIQNKDVARLSSIPGVGAKTAERLTMELRDKLGHLAAIAGPETARAAGPVLTDAGKDAISALINLGYNKSEAEKAVERASADAGVKGDVAALIRLSLKQLRKE